ncbi:unnamed protein product [Tuber melanosporum]|uniref:(Perigord truffle) hypothetical protein n=1 Tax=Tuber melanosporum (strain Mel28) TaxID=656061 RepID=D5GPU2_TUBMM|nr:uncharacterized protein GSTUM_00012032001 [Tuber melanosporum]CAZ86535.1 unnamed protein product [Tuber melanosporum]
MATTTTTTKTLYRSLLRELPPISQKRTHLHHRLRGSISGKGEGDGGMLLLAQLTTYLRAQRTYSALLERYNPSLGEGSGGGDDDRVRMSARRVGLHVPE